MTTHQKREIAISIKEALKPITRDIYLNNGNSQEKTKKGCKREKDIIPTTTKGLYSLKITK